MSDEERRWTPPAYCPDCDLIIHLDRLVQVGPWKYGATEYGCPECNGPVRMKELETQPEGSTTMHNTEVIATGLHTSPFDENDWLAYSGAERGPNGEAPRIARRGDWTVIADAAGVGVLYWRNSDSWHLPCESLAVAAAQADVLLGVERMLEHGETVQRYMARSGYRKGADWPGEAGPEEDRCICDPLYAAHMALENADHDLQELASDLFVQATEISGLTPKAREVLAPLREYFAAMHAKVEQTRNAIQRQDDGLQADVRCPAHGEG